MVVPFTIRLAPEILEAVDPSQRSRDGLIAEAVQDYAALNTWQLERVETGLAEADAGAFACENDVARIRAKFADLE